MFGCGFELGDCAKDKITGFEGIVTSLVKKFQGGVWVGLTPQKTLLDQDKERVFAACRLVPGDHEAVLGGGLSLEQGTLLAAWVDYLGQYVRVIGSETTGLLLAVRVVFGGFGDVQVVWNKSGLNCQGSLPSQILSPCLLECAPDVTEGPRLMDLGGM